MKLIKSAAVALLAVLVLHAGIAWVLADCFSHPERAEGSSSALTEPQPEKPLPLSGERLHCPDTTDFAVTALRSFTRYNPQLSESVNEGFSAFTPGAKPFASRFRLAALRVSTEKSQPFYLFIRVLLV